MALKVDGMARMTGTARFTDDLTLPGMLHCRILRSPHARATIVSIDTSAALAMDGVYGAITGADLPVKYGIIPWTRDEYALALEEVRYVGDAVAAVAARDEETADAALEAIVVEYDVQTPCLDPVVAKQDPDRISKRVKLAFGEVDEAMAASDLVIEAEYYFHGTTHTPIEPHCAIARQDADGVLSVWSATQVPHYVHKELARVLERPEHSIRVLQPPIGGAFGGKSEPFDLEFVVARLAIDTGRPVKCLYTREEVFFAHRGRHPVQMQVRTGFSKDGDILAVDAENLLDGGAYSSFGLVTTYYTGQLLASPYRFGTYRFDSTRVFTDAPACGPKRGHGSVQPRFAFEVQLDRAAVALNIDPIDLRRRTFIGEHSGTVNGFHIRTSGFLECLERVEQASNWKERRGRLPRGRGLGVAGSTYISGTNYCIYPTDLPQSSVHVGIDRSGRVRLYAGVSDIGQGCETTLAALAAETLGVELEDVRVLAGDSDLCPIDLGAYSSRITVMAGHACLEAAGALAGRIREVVAAKWECAPEQVLLANRQARRLDDESVSMPIHEAFRMAEAKGGALEAAGSYDTPKEGIHGDYRGASIGASPVYSYTAHVAEVKVDEDTGDVEVIRVWAAHDCGRAIRPLLVEGQIEGSVYMGAAEAVMEHFTTMPKALPGEPGPPVDGLLVGASLLEYPIPTSLDAPDVRALIVERPDPLGPTGAREAGEGPLHPVLPAIANAVYDAVGVRIDRLPITPERVLAALEAKSC